jgi:hypothetical protein
MQAVRGNPLRQSIESHTHICQLRAPSSENGERMTSCQLVTLARSIDPISFSAHVTEVFTCTYAHSLQQYTLSSRCVKFSFRCIKFFFLEFVLPRESPGFQACEISACSHSYSSLLGRRLCVLVHVGRVQDNSVPTLMLQAQV